MNLSSFVWNTDKDDPQILTINIPKLKIGPVKGSKITKVTGAHNPIYLELSVARTTLVISKTGYVYIWHIKASMLSKFSSAKSC